ncbi:Ig-like domain-containing protein [Anaeromyxobacter paludicola]|uniref:HYR domain-containing protein n=1 Tax=Anaeromyxobacter paludicola TaxID=2918171 RepID=A0ABN6N4H8_9BACT|nr:hypothetical protein [Anaeromyxobacter paludicola]BDG06948.1 hypothetical protein AMPC_00610 [Anaeromyxobacter paludicola]
MALPAVAGAVVSGASVTYAGASFGAGTSSNVKVDGSGNLALSVPTSTPGYAWIAGKGSGAVLRVDTATGASTSFDSVIPADCPACGADRTKWMPAAVAVDMDGQAWVVNTGVGAVTRFGASQKTIPVSTPGTLAPAIAVDSDGSVWVAAPGAGKNVAFYKVSASGQVVLNGTVGNLALPAALLARDGELFIAEGSNVRQISGSAKTATASCLQPLSGLALDGAGRLWASGQQGLLSIDLSAKTCVVKSAVAPLTAVAVDAAGSLWATGGSSAYRFSATGALQQTIGTAPVAGYGIDQAADGSLFVAGQGGYAKLVAGAAQVTPLTGYYGTSSDFTGAQLRAWVAKGSWDVVQDAGAAGAIWGTVSWVGPTTGVTAQVRAADAAAGLAGAPWVTVSNGTSFQGSGVAGRYLELKLTLTGKVGQGPVVSSVTVATYGKPDGAACGAASDCASGSCVDGVCCNTACAGQCEACNVAGSAGTCVAVTGAPQNGRPACASDGTACGGACDGTSRAACTYPSASTACREASCGAGVQTAAATCDGNGSCGTVVTVSCDAYVCGATACLTTCGGDADCSPRYECDLDPAAQKMACVADVTPPALTLDTLPPYTNQAARTVSGSVKDRSKLDWVKLTLNGAEIPVALQPDGSFSVSLTFAEGTNALVFAAADIAGNASSPLTASTVLDTVPPSLVAVAPAAGKAFGSSLGIPFELQVSDATPVVVSAGGQQFTPDATGKVSGTIDLQGSEGWNTLSFLATDAAGNTATQSVAVLLDFTAPVVTVDDLTPIPWATARDTLPVILHVDDLTATTVVFSDGQRFTNARSSAGALSAAALALADGPNGLSVTVTDEVGRATTLSWTVIYDHTPPTGSFASPAPGAFVRGTVELALNASDDWTGVASVAWPDGTRVAKPSFPAISSLDTTTLPDGAYTASAQVADGVGNTRSISLPLVVDNTPPGLGLGSLPAYVHDGIAITASADDPTSGVASVTIQAGSSTRTCESAECSLDFVTNTLGNDGPFTITATATDRAGNQTTKQVTIIAVNNAPKGFLVAPVDGAYVAGPLAVSVDASQVSYFQDVTCQLGDAPLVPTTTQAKLDVTVDTLRLLDGDLTVSCTATDLAGLTTTEKRTVHVRNWTEVLNPTTLNLRTGGSSVVTLYVEGKNVSLLVPQRASLKLGGPSGVSAIVNAVSASVGDYNSNGVPDLTVKFDRQSLINLLTAKAAAAGTAVPAGPVKLEVYAGGQLIGSAVTNVNR